jgi:heme o synthase
MSIRDYYDLTKPGIVYGNAITVVAGFFLASRNLPINWQLLLFTVLGLSCVVASACVFNNYFDRNIDAKMERTKKRAFAAGTISPVGALLFGALLFVFGVFLLWFVNLLALGWAMLGFVVYVFVYTPLKHKTGLAVFVGAIAGATPPVVGYTAVGNMFDMWALALFVFLFVWQLPHFLAIATYRYDEYAAAGIPLLVKKPKDEQTKKIARKIFLYSLVVLLLVCVALILQRWIR